MAPAIECKTHNFVAKTPRRDEATEEELQEMTNEYTAHVFRKGKDSSLVIATMVITAKRLNSEKECTPVYHEVTPPGL